MRYEHQTKCFRKAWIWRVYILVGRVRPKWDVLKNTFDQVAHVFSFIILLLRNEKRYTQTLTFFFDLYWTFNVSSGNFWEVRKLKLQPIKPISPKNQNYDFYKS